MCHEKTEELLGMLMGWISIVGILGLGLFSSPLLAEDFGAWSLMCEPEGQNCSISQVVATDPMAKKVVMGLSVNFFASRDRPSLNIRVTSKALARAGVGFKVDELPPAKFPVNRCDANICLASVWMDDQLIEEMRHGKMAVVAYFFLPSKKQVTLPVSLNGFAEALDALREKNTIQR